MLRSTNVFKVALISLLIVSVSGCMQQLMKLDKEKDNAPLIPLNSTFIEDAVPRPDPIISRGNKSPYTVNGQTYEVLDSAADYRQEGIGSWYGTKFHGRQTSNGETYSLYAMTAAHRSLPIPSYVRVTNRENGRSTVVRVNDRGPFHSDRIIDLSYAAASKLGYANNGTARLTVEALEIAGQQDLRFSSDTKTVVATIKPAAPLFSASGADDSQQKWSLPVVPERAAAGKQFYVQVAAFKDQNNAKSLLGILTQQVKSPSTITQVRGEFPLYKVRLGPFASRTQANETQAKLEELNLGPGHVTQE